jgi:hypothetical protein
MLLAALIAFSLVHPAVGLPNVGAARAPLSQPLDFTIPEKVSGEL